MDAQFVPLEEATSVLNFWFEELSPKQWFISDTKLDSLIKHRFYDVHRAACNGELWPWRATPLGRLAEIIVLDQFSRNIHRDTPAAFSNDTMALALAQEAISVEADQLLTPQQRAFLYMPFMHSESLEIHDVAMQLFDSPGLEQQLNFEHRHRDIIVRFGRYPHRNAILGRPSSTEEQVYLQQPGAGF